MKEIHIGSLIKKRVKEIEIDKERLTGFFNCNEQDILEVYHKKTIDSQELLKWSKLLKYDFFRIYSGHLILYAPLSNPNKKSNPTRLPVYKKNVYTKEIIDYFIEVYNSKEKTVSEIIEDYQIPKTTLYKWLKKYNSN